MLYKPCIIYILFTRIIRLPRQNHIQWDPTKSIEVTYELEKDSHWGYHIHSDSHLWIRKRYKKNFFSFSKISFIGLSMVKIFPNETVKAKNAALGGTTPPRKGSWLLLCGIRILKKELTSNIHFLERAHRSLSSHPFLLQLLEYDKLRIL